MVQIRLRSGIFTRVVKRTTPSRQLRLPLFDRVRQRTQARAQHGRTFWRDAIGVGLILLGIITLLSLLGLNTGGLVAAWTGLLRAGFGSGAYIFALILVGLGVPLALNQPFEFDKAFWRRVIIAELGFFALLALIHSIGAYARGDDGSRAAAVGTSGGAIGWVLSSLIVSLQGLKSGVPNGITILLWLALLSIAAVVLFRDTLWHFVVSFIKNATPPPRILPRNNTRPSAPTPSFTEQPRARAEAPPLQKATSPSKPMREADAIPPAKTVSAKAIKADIITNAVTKKGKIKVERELTLPPLTLLKASKATSASKADVKQQAAVIERTLQHFGLAGNVVEIRQGPAVTQFGVEPGFLERSGANGERRPQKIRVGQIASLRDDLALALSATSLRIEAPIPGRKLVGIEVPNTSVGVVDLRGIIESEAFQKIKQPLAIALGADVSGTPTAADLGRMPHLLIAGTTGSGKSVCMSAIIMCLAMNNHPDDLKMVMIDPKMVELSRFVGLPHIIGKPEAEMERIPGVLRWVTREMDDRYKKFALLGARNLQDYNGRKTVEEKLPRMVVLVDELADLMLQSPIETEKTLCRLAQMARATGIHLVVATQRPSVDVVTGLIKANFPARIAFAVASSMDSRVILDQTGAEELLGRGDMLFLNPEVGSPMRLQGCWVNDKEITNLINWWKSQIENEKADEEQDEPVVDENQANRRPKLDTPWELEVAQMASEKAMMSSGRGGSGGDDDEAELMERAMQIIQISGNVSTSLLQRKLRLGYPRAARLMEELREMGYVGAPKNKAAEPSDN